MYYYTVVYYYIYMERMMMRMSGKLQQQKIDNKLQKDKRRRYNHVQHGINSNAHWSDPKLALDHSCAMNFDRQYQKQEKKAERAQFEPNYQSMSSRAENDDTLQTRKNNPTADYRTPLGTNNGRDYQSRSGSTSEISSTTQKRRKKNHLRTETDEIKRLNERLHQPESTKKQDPNTYNSMLQVGEGFYNQARLIDDLIARTEEDIRQQQATIEDKQERKRNYKEISICCV